MLNSVLELAYDMGILQSIGIESTKKFVSEVVHMGRRHDCNAGEILEEIGEKLGICYSCLKETDDFEDGLCKECRE